MGRRSLYWSAGTAGPKISIFSMTLAGALSVCIPISGMAEEKNQTEWVRQGGALPGGKRPATCNPVVTVQQLVAYCVGTSDGFFWRWYDFNTHTCQPNREIYRTVEWSRDTGERCSKKDYDRTERHASSYGETWTASGLDPNTIQDGPASTPPPPSPEGTKRPEGRTADVTKLPEDGKKTATPDPGVKTNTRTSSQPRRAKTQTATPPSDTRALDTMIGVGVGVGMHQMYQRDMRNDGMMMRR